MQWTQSERFWADWSRTAFRFQRAFPQLHLLHFTRPHKMPKVQALPVHWDIGCPSRQRMLQFGPSPAMQEATWATRYQLLKLTSFDLYITVYHIYIYIVYILYCHSASSPWTGLSHPPRGDGRTRDHLPLPQPKRQDRHFMAFPPFQNPLKISSKGQKMSKIFL